MQSTASQLEDLRAQVAALTSKVDLMQRKEEQREAVLALICGSGNPEPRHLHAVS